jgi:hypothetical protein
MVPLIIFKSRSMRRWNCRLCADTLRFDFRAPFEHASFYQGEQPIENNYEQRKDCDADENAIGVVGALMVVDEIT